MTKLQNLIFPKIGHGLTRVIIGTNYDGTETQMLDTMFYGNRSAGSKKENFKGLTKTFMRVAAILVM